jgi:acetyl/propionyl-CoA carboxylase alpha subunit
MFDRVLVANRGEIAARVLDTCRRMGIEGVAVHASDDEAQPHVRLADRAVDLGSPGPQATYLSGPRLVEAAVEEGCDAVHPGYGFLSEDASFARRVEEAGLTWVGPPPIALESLGDKARALSLADDIGVPITPGSDGPVETAGEAREVIEEIGTPSVLKAVHGGGGMGMRRVEHLDEVEDAFHEAREQAENAFGSPEVLVERWWTDPRHLEVQIAFDREGNGVHLFERECSIQRRRQKLVEEGPSPIVGEELRGELTDHALSLCATAEVHALATVEFLYTEEGPVFNEVNPRLQVEHTVTEEITGYDLVEWQLRLAAGEPLPARQDEITKTGHSIQARINVEDPLEGFAPAPGPVTHTHVPTGEGIRVDHALVPGGDVAPHYDSLVAKVISHGADRSQAIERLRSALAELRVGSRPTTAGFLRYVLGTDRVRRGDMDTGIVDDQLVDAYRRRVRAAMARLVEGVGAGERGEVRLDGHEADWQHKDGRIRVDGEVVKPAGERVDRARVELEGYVFEGEAAPTIALETGAAAQDEVDVESPIPGTVDEVLVADGDEIEEGDTLVVVEAMKMKNEIGAPQEGTVEAVEVAAGEDVDQKQPLVTLDTE